MNNPLVQPDPGLFIWTIITFLVLLTLLAKYAWKPLLELLEKREETIRKSLDDAEKAREELERLTTEGDEIIAKARSEAQSIIAEGKSAAEKVRNETIQMAREQASGLLDKAEKQIQAEKDKAIEEIKSEVVDLSLSVAEKLIKKNLSSEENQAMIEESLKGVKPYDA